VNSYYPVIPWTTRERERERESRTISGTMATMVTAKVGEEKSDYKKEERNRIEEYY